MFPTIESLRVGDTYANFEVVHPDRPFLVYSPDWVIGKIDMPAIVIAEGDVLLQTYPPRCSRRKERSLTNLLKRGKFVPHLNAMDGDIPVYGSEFYAIMKNEPSNNMEDLRPVSGCYVTVKTEHHADITVRDPDVLVYVPGSKKISDEPRVVRRKIMVIAKEENVHVSYQDGYRDKTWHA